MNNKQKKYDKSLSVTIIMIFVLAFLFIAGNIQISRLIEQRSISRMEEGVNTAIEEVTNKLQRDSDILNATAELLSTIDDFDPNALHEMMGALSPLMETARMRMLLPDGTIIGSSGETVAVDSDISFEEEAALGEHISGRTHSVINGGTDVMRHYVPIVQDGKPAALLYSLTILSEMPETMNIDNIFNYSASVYIIDTKTGDFIMDTLNNELGNIKSLSDRNTKNAKNWAETANEIMNGDTGYVIFNSEITNEWCYLYYAPANINGWEIAISVPESMALSHLFAVKKVLLHVGISMALAIAVYYLWVLKNSKMAMEKAVEQAVLETRLQKAEAAERAKTMFLSNMSHDIRTPMNAIIGFATLAQTNLDNRERVQSYLAKILSAGEHLLSLINDVLDMSRIESGRLHIEEKECTISDIFRDMRNIILTQMQAKQLDFFMDTIDVADEDIYCDKLHLNQVLLNLLSNAIKFTPAGGSVSLTLKQKPGAPENYGAYEIRVKDTGIGMSPEFVQHIFEPFERERTSTVSGIQGTGLGMAISKSIVEAMGGTIKVESQQGKGTEFIIDVQFRLMSEPRKIETVKELTGLRALVVDDSYTTCDSVSKMLVQMGMRADWTMHGKEAVLRAKQASDMGDAYHAYIIDWAIPDLIGIEVIRQIRASVGESAPVIILTAYDWSLFEDEAKQAGATAFCNKPLFISDLKATLASAIGTSAVSEKNESSLIPDTSQDIKGKRILLVEDNELNREIAQEVLSESDFVVETAIDGSLAVEMVEKSTPGYYDLILMDIQMPIMDGYSATKAIRALPDAALSGIPIVAMTANAFEEDKKKALDCGMNAHVTKPINVPELLEVIQKVLKK